MKLIHDLQELTDSLQHLSKLIGVDYNELANNEDIIKKFLPSSINIDTLEGKIECQEIIKTKEFCVIKIIAIAETICKEHSHEEFQLLCCTKGEIFISVNGKLEHLLAAEHILIRPKSEHGLYFSQDSRLIIIIFPYLDENIIVV